MNHLLLGFALLFAAVRALAVSGDDWRYRDIVELIEQRATSGAPFRSPDELIEALPEGLRRNFTFVYETGNKFQDADPRNPRALVFNRNLIYAFNGHPDQRGYSVIEVMELDREKKTIELRE